MKIKVKSRSVTICVPPGGSPRDPASAAAQAS